MTGRKNETERTFSLPKETGRDDVRTGEKKKKKNCLYPEGERKTGRKNKTERQHICFLPKERVR